MLLVHLTSALSALLRSAQYAWSLSIKGNELWRYFKKSFSLGLCYAGFGTKRSIREAWMAGEAAFLCCAYDVVTDWRHFDPVAREAFESILSARAPQPELHSLAIGLYEKELSNQLEDDGLDRGAIALRFTLKMMGCEKAREVEWGDVDEIGRLFQIVDDVLDYEQDLTHGDTNCLATARKDSYLKELLDKLGSAETRRLFGSVESVLVKVIGRARLKAQALLNADMNEIDSAAQLHMREG